MNKSVITIILLLALFTAADLCQADLRTSVGKFREVAIPPALLGKKQSYDHLVRYFTSFSYFKLHHKVSPEFIHALILAESSGNPRAISNKNALGLGQIIFTTAQPAAKALAQSGVEFEHINARRLQNLKRHDLFDPAINILLTCYLISKYNYKFDGRLELVLSAWNAGENTGSLEKGKHAPYQETEELIGKVNGYYLYLLNEISLSTSN